MRFPYRHERIRVNNIRLHVVFAGPEDGPPVILLHGFPEFWYGWRRQIAYLAEQGYRVIAPDQRGYNLSDKPKPVAAYHISNLTKDIIGLIDALHYERVYLVGHDWGAAVAWWIASESPHRLRKLVIMNVPYPTLLIKTLQSGNIGQLLKSWYIFYFQLPRLPEALLGLNNGKVFGKIVLSSSKPDSFTQEDIRRYQAAWKQPGAIPAMLNWYRAFFRFGLSRKPAVPPKKSIETPTLILWGEQDVALGKELAQSSIQLCKQGQLIFFPDTTHWIQHDEAAVVNRHLSEFLVD